jgi:(p)ppGpp synthase/HD superfamily hydrolase
VCEKHFFNKDEARKEMDELAVLFDRLWKEPMSSKEKQLQAALKLAVDAHFGQTRKSDIEGVKIPYALHPIQVMERLRSWGIGDVDVLTACCTTWSRTRRSQKRI